jgi:hypothetical protein
MLLHIHINHTIIVIAGSTPIFLIVVSTSMLKLILCVQLFRYWLLHSVQAIAFWTKQTLD